jgi:protein-disulfide isomerase
MAARAEQKRIAREQREANERAELEQSRRKRRLTELAAIAAAAIVAVAILIAVSSGGATKQAPAPASSTLFSGIPASGATLGNPRAPVTLVEYADLQCPFCAEFDRNVLPTLVDRYVRAGRVKIESRPLRFLGDDSARAAAVAAAAAEQDKLWPFVDAFYHRQGQENSGYVTDDFLRQVLGAVPGIDVERALSDAGDPKAEQLPARAEAEANAAGISSTPSFRIGSTGGKLSDLKVSSLEPGQFTEPIDAALASAQ